MTGSDLTDAMKNKGLSNQILADLTGCPVKKIREWKKYGVPFYAVGSLKKALGMEERNDSCLDHTVKTPGGVRFGVKRPKE